MVAVIGFSTWYSSFGRKTCLKYCYEDLAKISNIEFLVSFVIDKYFPYPNTYEKNNLIASDIELKQ